MKCSISTADDAILKDTIMKATQKLQNDNLPTDQIGIEFIQIGSDRNLRGYLTELGYSHAATKVWEI